MHKVLLLSDVGLVREKNQDNYVCNQHYIQRLDHVMNQDLFELEQPIICGVSDGVGGLALGEVASYIAARTVSGYYEKIRNGTMDVKKLIMMTNKLVGRESELLGRHLGCTLSLIYYHQDQLQAFNVGDSHIYLFHEGKLEQLSVNHTEAEMQRELYAALGIDRPIDENKKHVLTQYIGIKSEEFIIEPSISKLLRVDFGDYVLITTDGLTDTVEDQAIQDVLGMTMSSEDKIERLHQMALEAGGVDNITIVLLEI